MVMFFEGCNPQLHCTIFLRGANKETLRRAKRVLLVWDPIMDAPFVRQVFISLLVPFGCANSKPSRSPIHCASKWDSSPTLTRPTPTTRLPPLKRAPVCWAPTPYRSYDLTQAVWDARGFSTVILWKVL